MRISDWSSDVCSSDLQACSFIATAPQLDPGLRRGSRSTPYFSPSSIPLQTTSRSLTAATDLSKPALASPFNSISTTRPTPPAPITTGTRTYQSSTPHSPVRCAAHGSRRFLSLRWLAAIPIALGHRQEEHTYT